MKRTLILLAVLFALLALPAAAQTDDFYRRQAEAAGVEGLTEPLPADTRELLEELGLTDWDPAAYTGLSLNRLQKALSSLAGDAGGAPLQAAGSLLGVIVLSALFGGLEDVAERPALRQNYRMVSALAAAGILIAGMLPLLTQVGKTVDSVTVFMDSFVPVYAGILAAGGNAAAAVSYQTMLFTAAQLFHRLIRGVILPVLPMSLALGCIGAAAQEMHPDAISDLLHKLVLWVLGLLSAVFGWVLSIQQMVAAAGDTLGSKALKFSLATVVPVVGGVLSEACSTVLGCAGLLRSTVGCFGTVATVLILTPSLLRCLCWCLCLRLGGGAAVLFRLPEAAKLCRTALGTVRSLIAVLAVLALLMIVSVSVISFSRGGVT